MDATFNTFSFCQDKMTCVVSRDKNLLVIALATTNRILYNSNSRTRLMRTFYKLLCAWQQTDSAWIRTNEGHEKKQTGNYESRLVVTSYKDPDRNGLFDNCTKVILQELQQEDGIDLDEESSSAKS